MAVAVSIEGAEELVARLERIGRLEAVRALVERIAGEARDRAREYARPHPVDTGGLAQGIEVVFPRELEVLVRPSRRLVGIAETVEEGRPPGRRPPKAAIERWAERHGIATPAWVLATRIAREGTRGVRMFARAAEDAERLLRSELERAGRRLVEGS